MLKTLSDKLVGMSRLAFRLILLCVGLALLNDKSALATDELRFSHSRGYYDVPFAVKISVDAPGANVYFTLNGDRPTPERATVYSSPISIRTSSILRATAYKDGVEICPPVTQTYLFPKDVIRQNGEGFPKTWGTNQGQAVVADYAMDADITTHADYRDEILPALRSLPAVSLVLEQTDLFDPVRGIYANPKETGADWERPASLEFIPIPAQAGTGMQGIQVNCGIRIQGGWNRRPEESPKHSFRVVFRKKYGPGKLRYPLFGEEAIRDFDEIILRSGCNNTWLHWKAEERRRGEFVRDQWMRDTFSAMGHPSARGLFAHLYINGLYWGLYNPVERPSAPFIAAHFGGKPEYYDVRNADNIIEGDDVAWLKLLALANDGVAEAAAYQAIETQLDVGQLVDFLILNFYGANADWDRSSNWYAARSRKPPGPYRFYVWDGERTLEDIEANSMDFDDDQSPMRLFHKLEENAAFCRLFAQRARLHLTGNGALTPSNAGQRYRRWASQIEQAVIAESARWGDYRRDAHPYKTGPYELYTRNEHWRPEVRRLLEEYFPKRTAEVIRQFKKAGLY
jgi:hypothetical protein